MKIKFSTSKYSMWLGAFVLLIEEGKSYSFPLEGFGVWEKMQEKVSQISGFKSWEGPFINKIVAVTFTFDGERDLDTTIQDTMWALKEICDEYLEEYNARQIA